MERGFLSPDNKRNEYLENTIANIVNLGKEEILDFLEKLEKENIENFLLTLFERRFELFRENDFCFDLLFIISNRIEPKKIEEIIKKIKKYNENIESIMRLVWVSIDYNEYDEKITIKNYKDFISLISDYSAFINILEILLKNYLFEKSIRDLIGDLFMVEEIKNNPIYYVYLVYAFSLHLDKYLTIKDFLKEINASYYYIFCEYENLIREINQLLNKKNDLNSQIPSYGIEIESLNVHKLLEIDSPITNNVDDIIQLIAVISKLNYLLFEKIDELCRLNPEFCQNNPYVNLYNSFHINIGLPERYLKPRILENLNKLLNAFIFIISLIFNNLDRSYYILNFSILNQRPGEIIPNLLALDELTDNPYKRKIQSRLFCLHFLPFGVSDYEFYQAFFGYLNKIFQLEPDRTIDKIKMDLEELIRIIYNNAPPEYLSLLKELDVVRKKDEEKYDIRLVNWKISDFESGSLFIKSMEGIIFLPKRDEVLSIIIKQIFERDYNE
ncbi:MAG: hypothetical protein NZ866_00945 [Patescibacteria group bacterium]|nr:hypothetical protein [Patescibacteria group bacterium]